MQEEIDKAIDRYSKAVARRIRSKSSLLKAEKEDIASRHELMDAKTDLRTLELELGEGILVPGLVLSSKVLETKHEQPA